MPDFWPWAFPVDVPVGYTGPNTTVPRTLPERLSEIVDIRDWGALGDGSNDAPRIQAAIDFCIFRGGGKVFFPPGQYACSANLVVGSDTNPNAFVQLIGGGGGGIANTKLGGPGTGWLISKGSKQYDLIQSVEGLGFSNTGCIKVTGGVRIAADGTISGGPVSIKNCYLAGVVLVDASQANGVTISDCGGSGFDSTNADSSGPKVFSSTGVGLYLGDNCTAANCRLTGDNWITYALSGKGASLIACSTERTYTAVRVGWAPDANPAIIGGGRELAAVGCSVIGLQTERQTVTVDLFNAVGCYIAGNFLSGGHGPDRDQSITNMVYSGGFITATTVAAHNLPVGNSVLLLNVISEAEPPIPWRPNLFTTCTNLTPTTFRYAAPDPGVAYPGGFGWAYPPLFGIRCRKVSETVIVANQLVTGSSLASVDLQYGAVPQPYNQTVPGEAVHSNNVFIGQPGQRGWLRPTGENAAGWRFINCGIGTLFSGSNPSASNSPVGSLTFNKLPGQFSDPTNQWQSGPFEGQEFDISDGAKAGGGSAVWGDQVQAGGTGVTAHYKVRYDGSVWRRIG